ncbi:MAG: hypothetical protein NXI31_13655 [bacterium]|nr:hypothetical protein [bacterium]
MSRALAGLLLFLLVPALIGTATAQGKNLLFYGNSYTFYSFGYGVPELVGLIAEAAGEPSPTIVQALVGGSNLQFHATDPAQVAKITTGLAPGQTWDHVILQENSVGATPYFGFSPAVFRSSARTILGNVRVHSPAAKAVMYQTWARAWGHMYYPSPWSVPMAMHTMVRQNHDVAVADLEAAFGSGAATKAAVGDAVALLEWSPAWYHPDRSHPGPAMTLLAAMCIYTSIYGGSVCEVDPGFPSGPIAAALAPHGIKPATWHLLAGVAQRCATPANRRFPGSGDHLLLASAVDGEGPTACPSKRATTGANIDLQLRSLNGIYDGAFGAMLLSLAPTGSPPGPLPTYPELHLDPARVIATPFASLDLPHTMSFSLPFSLPGSSLLVQGVALKASSASGNPVFTATDAHELVLF